MVVNQLLGVRLVESRVVRRLSERRQNLLERLGDHRLVDLLEGDGVTFGHDEEFTALFEIAADVGRNRHLTGELNGEETIRDGTGLGQFGRDAGIAAGGFYLNEVEADDADREQVRNWLKIR